MLKKFFFAYLTTIYPFLGIFLLIRYIRKNWILKSHFFSNQEQNVEKMFLINFGIYSSNSLHVMLFVFFRFFSFFFRFLSKVFGDFRFFSKLFVFFRLISFFFEFFRFFSNFFVFFRNFSFFFEIFRFFSNFFVFFRNFSFFFEIFRFFSNFSFLFETLVFLKHSNKRVLKIKMLEF
jgi:hypothetical protein